MSEHKIKTRRLWFRAKEFGWGWYPISWQGWLITVLYALLFTCTFLLFFGWIGAASESHVSLSDLLFGITEFLGALALLSFTLYRICKRFGEKPEWRLGPLQKLFQTKK